eukprot:jgi/Mesvir1/27867/Mv08115-RA.1
MESREINNRVFRCDNGEMKLMSKFGISLSAPSVDISAQTLRVNNAPLSSLQISDGAITTEKLDPDLLARLPAASDLYKPFTGSFTASPGHEVSGFFTGSYNELRDKPDSLISGLRTELNALQAEVQAIGGVTLDEITSITVLDQGGDPLTSTHRVKEVTVVFGSDVATGSFTANDVNASFVYSSTLPLSDAVSGLTNVSGDTARFASSSPSRT